MFCFFTMPVGLQELPNVFVLCINVKHEECRGSNFLFNPQTNTASVTEVYLEECGAQCSLSMFSECSKSVNNSPQWGVFLHG